MIVKLVKACFSITGMFAGIAAGAWAVNKADKELSKVISRQFERENLVREEEEED